MSASRTDLRFVLREHTHAAHERVDAMAGARFDLGAREPYRQFLLWNARLVPALEAHLGAHGISDLLPDWPERLRTEALKSDLAALGTQLPASEVSHMRGEPAALIGIAYVLEGSRLGGAILAKMVSSELNGRATAYLTHGAGQKLWPRFVETLNALDFSPQEVEASIAAANAVFSAFEAALAVPRHSQIQAAL